MTHKVWFHILLNCGCILDTCRQPFSYHDGHSTSNVLWLNNSSCLNQLYYIAASVPLGLKSLGISGISGRTSRRRSLSLGESSKNGLQQSQGAGGWRRLEGLYVLGVWPIVVLRPYKQTPILSVQNVSINKTDSGTTFFMRFQHVHSQESESNPRKQRIPNWKWWWHPGSKNGGWELPCEELSWRIPSPSASCECWVFAGLVWEVQTVGEEVFGKIGYVCWFLCLFGCLFSKLHLFNGQGLFPWR